MGQYFGADYDDNKQEEYFGLLLNNETFCADYKDFGKRNIGWYKRLLTPRISKPIKGHENGIIYPYKVGEVYNVFQRYNKDEIVRETELASGNYPGNMKYIKSYKYYIYHYRETNLDNPENAWAKRFCTVSVVGYTKVRNILEKEMEDYILYLAKAQIQENNTLKFIPFKIQSSYKDYKPSIQLEITRNKIFSIKDFPIKYKINQDMNLDFAHPDVPTLRDKWNYLCNLSDILDVLTYAMDRYFYPNEKFHDYQIAYDKTEYIHLKQKRW